MKKQKIKPLIRFRSIREIKEMCGKKHIIEKRRNDD